MNPTPPAHHHPLSRLRIGLTGGIGSGKSTVASLLVQHGAWLIDTDAIARELTLPGGAAIAAIRTTFGDPFIDASGALDRTRMRELAFADTGAKRRLEAILHPLIGAEAERRFEASGHAVVVFDVPLLVESGDRWRRKVDKVLVVDCLEATQIERVSRRTGWTREAASAVVAHQASRATRRACADAVIFNDTITLAQLADDVAALWRCWSCPADSA
ncbi:MAG TPA: dephospho-CoA kinase [Burkholderiaceae bacterium]